MQQRASPSPASANTPQFSPLPPPAPESRSSTACSAADIAHPVHNNRRWRSPAQSDPSSGPHLQESIRLVSGPPQIAEYCPEQPATPPVTQPTYPPMQPASHRERPAKTHPSLI